MKRKLMITGIAVGALVLALGTAAFAHAHGREGRGEGRGRHDGIGMMMKGLDLTADQQARIGKLREDLTAKARPLDEKLRGLKDQERAAWEADAPDENRVIALHRETLRLRGELDELRIANRFDVMGLLTPAQRATLRERHESRPDRGHR
jgi:Spy/CpxP family protein refolding chaperone